MWIRRNMWLKIDYDVDWHHAWSGAERRCSISNRPPPRNSPAGTFWVVRTTPEGPFQHYECSLGDAMHGRSNCRFLLGGPPTLETPLANFPNRLPSWNVPPLLPNIKIKLFCQVCVCVCVCVCLLARSKERRCTGTHTIDTVVFFFFREEVSWNWL